MKARGRWRENSALHCTRWSGRSRHEPKRRHRGQSRGRHLSPVQPGPRGRAGTHAPGARTSDWKGCGRPWHGRSTQPSIRAATCSVPSGLGESTQPLSGPIHKLPSHHALRVGPDACHGILASPGDAAPSSNRTPHLTARLLPVSTAPTVPSCASRSTPFAIGPGGNRGLQPYPASVGAGTAATSNANPHGIFGSSV